MRLSLFAYRLLLLAFPAELRREFGADMARMFVLQVEDARHRRSSVARLWIQAIIGLAIGLTGGVVLMRTFRTMLFGVAPADPITLSIVGVGLLATALAACAIPALRASRVSPVTALRIG